jgi:hypothetical protein
MRLSELVKRDLAADPEITGVTADSRKVKPGYLFAALPGVKADGAEFAAKAEAAGAVAVIASRQMELPIPTVETHDPRRAYALAAARFWGAQPRPAWRSPAPTARPRSPTSAARYSPTRASRLASMGTLGVTRQRPRRRRRAAHPAGPDHAGRRRRGRDAGDARRQGRHPLLHGGLVARRRPAPAGRRGTEGRRLPEPDPGPPRLPRRHGHLSRAKLRLFETLCRAAGRRC